MENIMPSQQERRGSERISFKQAYPYELMRGAGAEISGGQGYVINQSAKGLLLMLPELVDQKQVFEIRMLSDASKEQITKLMEVRWMRPVAVNMPGNLHLVGAHVLFELPATQDTTTEPH